ncbi:MAG TPA: ABC transporter permease [Vicinamibacterales bacterium]
MIDSIVQDLRYAVRRVSSTPAFTLAIVATLGLGIGATTATFSIVDAAVLRSLPFPDADSLVRLRGVAPQGEPFPLSEPEYLDYSRSLTSFSAIGAMKPVTLTLTGVGDPISLRGAAVSSSLFGVLGIRPELGRLFTDADDRPGAPGSVVVISHALWQRRFGGDPGTIGRFVRLDDQPHVIAGVLGPDAAFPSGDVWVPLGASTSADRTDRWLDLVGRVAPGRSIEQARAEASALAATLAGTYPDSRGWSVQLVPLSDWLIGPGLRRMVWVLLGAVGVLMVLSCSNIAGLLVTRAAGRRGEMAVRAALGAERPRLVRQLMTESVLFATAGCAVGVLTAYWTVDALSALLGNLLPLDRVAHVDGRALAFSVAVAVASAIGFGLTPSLYASGVDLQAALKPAGRGSTPGGRRWADALVGVQVALAMLLLVAALLLTSSFARLLRVDVGFDTRNVLSVPLDLPERGYAEPRRSAFFDQAVTRISALPGVESVAATATDPFRQWGFANDVTPEERAAETPPSGFMQAGWRSVTPGFFSTLRVPVLSGRGFTNADRDDAPRVAIVSQSLARRLWPGETAVGHRIYWGGVGGRTRTIVGVVGDVRDVTIDAEPIPMLYLPYGQLPLNAMTLIVRTRNVSGVEAGIRREIGALDPALPVADVRPLEANRMAAISAPRLRMVLLGVFGTAALLLASIGLYGVVSYTVAERTREIAIRVAIGARPSQVSAIFFKRGIRLTALGGGVGLIAAWQLSSVLGSLLYRTDAHELQLFALATLVLSCIALAASYLPARRAARLDPLAALSREQL